MKIVTSFSPTRIDAQIKATNTWEKYDLEIVAVQCIGEDFAKQYTDNIVWVEPSHEWSKPIPKIIDLLKVEGDLLLVNSDIELEINLDDWKAEPNEFHMGIRTDYCPDFVQLNKFGIDVFLIDEDFKKHLTNPIWALGIPGWDYWVVTKACFCNKNIIIHTEGMLHEAHVEQWNQKDHRRCGKLLDFEFEIPPEEIAEKIQRLTNRTHLRKRKIEKPTTIHHG